MKNRPMDKGKTPISSPHQAIEDYTDHVNVQELEASASSLKPTYS